MIGMGREFAIRRVEVEHIDVDGRPIDPLDTNVCLHRIRVHMHGVDPKTKVENKVSFDMVMPSPYAAFGSFSEDELAEMSRVAVLQAVIHEVDEHLLWRGRRRWDPHANEAPVPENAADTALRAPLRVEPFVPKSELAAMEARVRHLQLILGR